jgi:VWFA-related protein
MSKILTRLSISLVGMILLIQVGTVSSLPQAALGPTKPLQYEVAVVLKLIHVYVTDKKGNPVQDLAVSDFTVMDNGQPMKVTDFEKRVIRVAPAAIKEVVETSEAKPGLVSKPGLPATPPSVRKFFLFFDLAFNNLRGVSKAKKAAIHFLNTQVQPEDQVGVITYSMFGGIKVHEFLTADHGKIRDAIEALTQRNSLGRADEIEEWYWRLVQSQAGPDPKAEASHESSASPQPKVPDYLNEAKAQRAEAKRQTQAFIESLTILAKSLRYVPDQKQFILFSSGIPNSLIYGAQAGNPSMTTVGGLQFDPADSTLMALNEAMYKEFAVSGCAFYTFDTRASAMGADLFGWDTRGLETGGRSVLGKQSVFSDTTSVFNNDKLSGRDFLKRLSDATGGEYFSNIDRYEKNLDQVQALTGAYYVLGFPINERWDGKYHEIKVEVKRKGCEVRAQVGYFNPKPFSEYSDLEKRLHLFDLALNERALSRMPDRVPMSALASAVEGITRLAVLAKLPNEVTAKFSGKKLEFVAIFFDAKGEISDMVREEVDPAAVRGRDLTFGAGSSLKPGDYSCRLVVRDMDTGMSAVGSAKATIVKPQITGLALGTPLVLEARTGCLFLCAGARKEQEAYPWTEIYPFDSSLFSPVLAELPPGTTSVLTVVPCAVPAGGKPELVISVYVVDKRTGARTAIPIVQSNSVTRGPLEILTLELGTADIAAGSYYLHINAQDRTTGALGHTVTSLIITSK